MFTRVSLVLAAVLAATTIAAACEPLPHEELQPRKSDPAQFPRLGTVVALNGRDQTIEYTVVVPVWTRHRFPAEPRGWERLVPATEFGWQYKQVMRKAKMDRLKFFDAAGEEVAPEDVWKRLSIGTLFFVSADGNPVSAEHRKLLARDVLVVVDFDNAILDLITQEMYLMGAVNDYGISLLPNPLPRPEPR